MKNFTTHMFERDDPKTAYVADDDVKNWSIAIVFRGPADNLSPDERSDITNYARDILQRRDDADKIKKLIEIPVPN